MHAPFVSGQCAAIPGNCPLIAGFAILCASHGNSLPSPFTSGETHEVRPNLAARGAAGAARGGVRAGSVAVAIIAAAADGAMAIAAAAAADRALALAIAAGAAGL